MFFARRRGSEDASRDFGNTGPSIAQICREHAWAFRRLSRSPGSTVVVAVTLGLVIGGNAAIYSGVHAVLLKPLPYPGPDALVRVFGPDFWIPLHLDPANPNRTGRILNSMGRLAAQGARMALLGLALGAGASTLATRWIRGLLFGVQHFDPLTLGGVAFPFCAIALAACLIAARRAAGIEPPAALRNG